MFKFFSLSCFFVACPFISPGIVEGIYILLWLVLGGSRLFRSFRPQNKALLNKILIVKILFAINSNSNRNLLDECSQPANLQEKQCRRVYFWLYGIAYWMLIQQKLTPPVLLFSDFAGWAYLLFMYDKNDKRNGICNTRFL